MGLFPVEISGAYNSDFVGMKKKSFSVGHEYEK